MLYGPNELYFVFILLVQASLYEVIFGSEGFPTYFRSGLIQVVVYYVFRIRLEQVLQVYFAYLVCDKKC